MKILDLAPEQAARLTPLLQDLHALHVTEHPARYHADPDEQALEDWLKSWLQEQHITALIAESPQGALLGYVIFEIEVRPDLPIRKAETRIMVHQVAVAPAFRRMGVGLALLHETKRRAKKLNIATIATTYAPFNTASAALFQSLGLMPVLTLAEWRA